MNYLTKFDNEIWNSFWVIPKFASANLCMPIHDIIYYSTFICLLNLESVESGCGKEGEKIKMKLKAFFIVFEGLLFGEK